VCLPNYKRGVLHSDNIWTYRWLLPTPSFSEPLPVWKVWVKPRITGEPVFQAIFEENTSRVQVKNYIAWANLLGDISSWDANSCSADK
jgi:hypothetical protein